TLNPEAEMVEPRAIGVVSPRRRPGRSDRVLRDGVEIVEVMLAADGRRALAEPEEPHDRVIEGFGAGDVRHRDVDVVEPGHLDRRGTGISNAGRAARRHAGVAFRPSPEPMASTCSADRRLFIDP